MLFLAYHVSMIKAQYLAERFRLAFRGSLNEREQLILVWHLDGKSLQEIASELGLSRERIRQIIDRIWGKLAHELNYDKSVAPAKLKLAEDSIYHYRDILSARTLNSINNNGINTLSELEKVVNSNPSALHSMAGIGNRGQKEILELLNLT